MLYLCYFLNVKICYFMFDNLLWKEIMSGSSMRSPKIFPSPLKWKQALRIWERCYLHVRTPCWDWWCSIRTHFLPFRRGSGRLERTSQNGGRNQREAISMHRPFSGAPTWWDMVWTRMKSWDWSLFGMLRKAAEQGYEGAQVILKKVENGKIIRRGDSGEWMIMSLIKKETLKSDFSEQTIQ